VLVADGRCNEQTRDFAKSQQTAVALRLISIWPQVPLEMTPIQGKPVVYLCIAMLIENKRGNYFFLKGIAPYSAGVVAEAGFEIVHVRLRRYVPLRAGFDAVEGYLKR